MVAFPPCKINLGLNVLARRSDGYHDLSTCFYPVPWTDVLEILPSPSFSFVQTGLTIPGDPLSNLCVKAYQLLKSDHDLPPVQIHLHKIIPTGAGLGGGSSDAAHTLRLLDRKFNLRLSGTALMSYAAQLGSDCSFFIKDEPMLGSGRGEVLQPCLIDLKGYYLVVVKPEIHVSTADAYRRVRPGIPVQPLETLLRLPVSEWRYQVKNDFEDSVFEQHPKLNEYKTTLYQRGAIYASMSGSGSAMFGIFEREMDLPAGVMDGLRWSGWL